MRIIVTGMRDWPDVASVWRGLDRAREAFEVGVRSLFVVGDLVVVEGGADGADRYARDWAKHHGIKNETHRADWAQHGKGAGAIRNRLMGSLGADLCLAFWNGKSPGTADMIRIAVECGIPVRIFSLAAVRVTGSN